MFANLHEHIETYVFSLQIKQMYQMRSFEARGPPCSLSVHGHGQHENLQRAALATRHGYTTEESHPKGSRTLECSKNQSFVFNALASLLLGMPPTLLRLSPPTQGFHVNTDCSMVVSAWKLSVSVFLFSNRCLHDFSKSTKQNNYMHSSDRSQQADAFKFLLLLSELLVIISYYNWSQSQKLLILILDWFSSSFSLDYP